MTIINNNNDNSNNGGFRQTIENKKLISDSNE